jgi:hypothetical protein
MINCFPATAIDALQLSSSPSNLFVAMISAGFFGFPDSFITIVVPCSDRT